MVHKLIILLKNDGGYNNYTPSSVAVANHWHDNSEKTVIAIVTQLLDKGASIEHMKKNEKTTFHELVNDYKWNHTKAEHISLLKINNNNRYAANRDRPGEMITYLGLRVCF